MNDSLEPKPDDVKGMFELVSKRLVEFLENIEQPSTYDMEASRKLAQNSAEPLPETTTTLESILDDLFDHRVVNALPTAHPGFMAYIPGGGIVHTAIAELIAKVTNRYVGIDATAPLLSQIETDTLKWFCQMVGYSPSAGGTLTSGGSIANLTAAICARTLVMGDDFSNGVVYASGFVHHSMWKALQAAGISKSNIREVSVDKQFRLDVTELTNQMETDVNSGLKPMMVVATAGSTNTGTIDPLIEVAKLCKRFAAWYHVDAAYGGFFSLLEGGKRKLKGIELADSITLDPHKGLFLPYGTGAFIVKDRQKLRSVFSHQADYIPDTEEQSTSWNFSELSLELTRPSRGLGIWLPFKLLGVEAFRKTLQEKLDLAQYFYRKIVEHKSLEIVAAPELTLTVFRYHNNELPLDSLNQMNRQILENINRKGRVNLSATIIDNVFVIRCCILSFRTHKKHVDWLLDDLQGAINSVENDFN